MTEQEMLKAMQEIVTTAVQPINERLGKLEAGQEELKAGQATLKKGQTAMQKDIDHIKEQVDIAYNWVDGIDLRVKALERG